MTIKEIEDKYDDILKSIKICKDNDFKESVFILTYAMIDSLSWLNSDEQSIVNRNIKKDFINFSNEYIVNQISQNISGEELYNARCAIVHTISTRSQNNIRHNSRYICYSNCKEATINVNIKLQRINENAVCIDAIELLTALVEAKTLFFNKIKKNNEKKNSLIIKANEYYSVF